jgi:hypothetical protein
MNQHKHNDPHHDPKRAAYRGFGAILFYCGFVSGLLAAGALLYGEMTKMNKSLFEALSGDSAVTLSLIAAFMVPLSLGWIARYLISGQRY